MARLLVRFGGGDAALLGRLLNTYGKPTIERRVLLPDRVVIDAHVAASTPSISDMARQAGTGLIIDPQTFYLQDSQHPGDPWARLPFADHSIETVSDLLQGDRADRLVAETLEFQLGHGATVLMAPYVHVERLGDGWAQVQAWLYRRTRRYLDAQNLHLPVLAPVALSWKLISRTSWPSAMDGLIDGLRTLHPDEVALAASKIDQGVHPEMRLAGLYAAIGRLRRHWPVIAWQQGILGEACVAAGAAGYETGIGWRERCDLRTRMAGHRSASASTSGGPIRPVYIAALGRSISKKTVLAALNDSVAGPQLICMDPHCCPTGRLVLSGDARAHAVIARAARLSDLDSAEHPRWTWQHVAQHARSAVDLAQRINRIAASQPGIQRVDISALQAIALTADVRRQTVSRQHVA